MSTAQGPGLWLYPAVILAGAVRDRHCTAGARLITSAGPACGLVPPLRAGYARRAYPRCC